MTTTQRNALIESYGNAYDMLMEALEEMPKEIWKWKPAADKWSIHEIIIHIADSEVNSYIRCRRLIAEPGSGVYGYNQDVWATKLNYHGQSLAEALELFKSLRLLTYHLLKTVDEQTWQTATVQHSEIGTVTMEQWLKTYEEHIPVHIKQMKRNQETWEKQQK